MIEEIIIKNEDDAWVALKKALSNELNDSALVVFEGWPVFKLTIEGEDFKGSIPTRIMPPILDLQKEIYRIYCNARYNTDDTRKLKPEERELLELIITVKPGSSKFVTNLFKALNEIIKNSNMNGKETIILLVSISAIIATSIGWKDWVGSRERQHEKDVTVRLSKQETARLKLITKAIGIKPEIKKNKENISDFKGSLSRKLKETDKIKINGDQVISGARAAEIVPKPKQNAQEIRLDGEFHINEVKFPKSFGGIFRFSVTRLTDGMSLMVDATPEKLTHKQITVLKDGGFGSKKVYMEINAKMLRGNISAANLFSIKWP